MAQDAHSLTEQAAYDALWRAAKRDGDGDRKVTIGLMRLARLARLSESSARRSVRSLVTKLAIEEIAAENSAERIGKTYRVFSYQTILARRRAAGLQWVVRNKAVRFVSSDGSELCLSPVPKCSPDSVTVPVRPDDTASVAGTATAAQTGSESPEWPSAANSAGRVRNPVTPNVPLDTAVVTELLARLGIPIDDDAARQIITACKAADSTATVEEISWFVERKVKQLERRNIQNWPGMLITAVPKNFVPPATELLRYRAEKTRERNQTEEIAREILANPSSPDDDRRWASSVLGLDSVPIPKSEDAAG